jgi:hypothetical protein
MRILRTVCVAWLSVAAWIEPVVWGAEPASTARKTSAESKPTATETGNGSIASPVQFEKPVRFEKRVLTDRYYCDGITAGDINRDGHVDVVAGPFWYAGPEFTVGHEFYPAKVFPTEPAPTDSMFSYVHDFNGDGWNDILVLGRVHLHQAFWYENPGTEANSAQPNSAQPKSEKPNSDKLNSNKPAHWKKHFAFDRVQGESPPWGDVDGDGRPELVAHWENRWGLIQPNPKEPTQGWSFRPITAAGEFQQFYHGTGIGDVNGDGRQDLILNEGWYEQPAKPAAEWKRHAFRFGERGGAQMFAYDVDGDSDNDVITSLDGHGWGLAWFEQLKEKGEATFKKHMIMGTRDEESHYGVAFSQPHALSTADIDGDGLQDIVVGKRYWAHGPKRDIEPMAEPVVYWFRLVREKGKVRYEPHQIDRASGVGVQITTADVDADGRPDVLTASKHGAFVFLNRPAAEGAAKTGATREK